MDDILQDFLAETAERLATTDQDILLLEQDSRNRDALARIFRAVHNIKSSAGFLHLARLQALSHAMETILVSAREEQIILTPMLVTLVLAGFDRLRRIMTGLDGQGAEPAGDDSDLLQAFAQAARQEAFTLPMQKDETGDTPINSMRVDVAVLENMMALTGELVLLRNGLQQSGDLFDGAGRRISLQKLHVLVSDMQAEVLKSRMQPVMQAFRALPRVLRDAAAAAGKQVRLTMAGNDTGLDRQVLEAIRDPLAHLLRNAVAHGIETPDERRQCGKPAEGTVHLSACYADGCVVIKITDDGRGLDTAKIAAQAQAQGLTTATALRGLSPSDIWSFVFAGGFSTQGQADHLAGRGVGLDIVRAAVEKIGGAVHVESQTGRGAVFTMRLPLTLAISPSIIVRAGGQRYALPQTAVSEMLTLKGNVEKIGEWQVLRLRDSIIPLLTLTEAFQMTGDQKPQSGKAVVLHGHKGMLALAVDDIDCAEDVVVKPLPEIFGSAGYFLGSAVLASGNLVLIVDANRLMSKYIRAGLASPVQPDQQKAQQNAVQKLTCVIFKPAGKKNLQALPLADVRRLADHAAAVCVTGNHGEHLFKTEDGRFIPLYGEHHYLRHAVVVQTGTAFYALAAEKILDIAEIAVTDLKPGDIEKGLRHRFLWRDDMVELLDADHQAQIPEAMRQEKGAADRRVLLIDDSPFFCRLMQPMLQTAGYDVVTVESAAEAMALCRQGQVFEAVISDIEMPGTNGLQLAAQMRSLPKGGDMPLLAISSYASARDELRARAAGFDHFLNKFDSAGLISALAKVKTMTQAGGLYK